MYIAFEGADGVGKTTLVNHFLKEYPKKFFLVEKHNIDAYPDLVQKKYLDVSDEGVKFFLYLAEHRHYDNQQRAFSDFLEKHVISDRSFYSLWAYTRTFLLSGVYLSIMNLFMKTVQLPDIVFYLQLSPELIEKRLSMKRRRIGVYEKKGNPLFWEELHLYFLEGFKVIGQRRVVVVDATKKLSQVIVFVEKILKEEGIL